MESQEYKAVEGCWRELQELISHDYCNIASSLHSKGLIDSDTEDKCKQQVSTSSDDIASAILRNILKSIELTPSLFDSFLQVLEGPRYKDVRDLLNRKCKKDVANTPINHSSSTSSSLPGQNVIVKAGDNIKRLEKEFCIIIEEFKVFLNSSKEKRSYFHELLMRQVNSKKEMEDHFIKYTFEEMKLEDVFKILKEGVFNFMNFEVLSSLIKECGDPDLIKRIECYENDIKSKFCNITVDQLIDHWNPPAAFSADIPEFFKTCAIRLLQDPNKCTTQNLRNIGSRFEALVLQQDDKAEASFRLVRISKSSVAALWVVFTDAWPKLMDEVKHLIRHNSDFTQEIQLASLILNDCILYPCTDREELWNASREGTSEVLRKLLQDLQVNPNTEYEIFQRSALQCAAKYGQQDSAKLLLEHGADINYQDARGCTALMIALRAGQASMVGYLLDYGADINIPEQVQGMSPVVYAVQNNNVQMFELFNKYHADLNARTKDKKTALIIAAENGNEEIVRSLVSKGDEVVDMEAQDIQGRTAVHAATVNGHTKIVEILLKYPNALFLKDMSNNTPKDVAVKNKNAELEDLFRPYFLEDEPMFMQEEDERLHDVTSSGRQSEEPTIHDITLPTKTDQSQVLGTSTGASQHKNALTETQVQAPVEKDTSKGSRLQTLRQSVVQTVIHAGNINVRLMRAASSGNDILAEELLKSGADPNTRKWELQKWTPLMMAAYKGHVSVAKVLLKYGADPNIVAIATGYTALILASKQGNHDIVECLLNPSNPVHVDVEATNAASGWGPLMWVSQSKFSSEAKSEKGQEKRCKILQSLVKAGVDINKPANNGWTPLMQASQDNNLKLVQIMCKIDGIHLDHESKSTWTAITTACRKGNEDIVIELTEAGADINKKKQGGYTALHMACYKGLLRAVQCMVPSSKQGASQRRSMAPDINVQDDWGMTPLILATKQGHYEVVKYLIDAAQPQINIQAHRYFQWTAVFFAIRNEDEQILNLLLEKGADINVTDGNNVTPENYANSSRVKKTMYKLIQDNKEPKKSHEQAENKIPSGRSLSIVDSVKYNQTELLWRARQQIYIILNI